MSARGFLAYVDAIGNADQVGVFEFDAGTLVSVIKQHVEACGIELGGERLAGFGERGVGRIGHGDDDREGRDRRRQPEAVLVVRLLDGRGENALDADAVAAHDGHDFLAVGVEHARAHGLGVLVAELEDVADFDGFADDELARAGLPSCAGCGQASPSFTLRMSAAMVQVKSRPGTTLRRW
jgi:hypothetical protein